MAAINPNAPSTPGQTPGATPATAKPHKADVEAFEEALVQNPPSAKTGSLFDDFVIDPNRKPDSIFDGINTDKTDNSKGGGDIDIDNYEPEKPEPPKPQEKKSNFWDSVWSGIQKGVDSVKEFLAKPEVAQFVRAANIVFAGAMVVAAGVLFATGVGAPPVVAALALAGGAGLAMQLPAVHGKLQAGVVAFMAPILGQENAEKLGPLLTQGLISGLMIAIVATGGSTGSAQGALDAAMGVFNSMKDVFNGIAQVYQHGGPVLEMLGINVDAKALQEMAGLFGTMGAMMPDLLKFADGIGRSLNHFLANPDMVAFNKFLGTLKDVPESLAKLMDSDFLKGLGSLLESGEKFLTDFKSNDFLNNFAGLIQLLSQGGNLAKA